MFKGVDYGRIIREALEDEEKERDEWRDKHRAQVWIVERVLLPLRAGLLVLAIVVFSPVLLIVWIVKWLFTGETWPLKAEP
jgi:lipopolysaccharide/colanic/teichoic acid biosynthesis glycosyltransferase